MNQDLTSSDHLHSLWIHCIKAHKICD